MASIIEQFIDLICKRVPSIPLSIRVFCKAVYDKMVKDGIKVSLILKRLSDYVIKQWICNSILNEPVFNGLLKAYQIKSNFAQNLKLITLTLNKIFMLDDSPFTDQIFKPLTHLFESQKQKITNFYLELINVPLIESSININQLFNKKSKFETQSICLSLKDVSFFFKFFMKYLDDFKESKQGISVLTQDLNFINSEENLFEDSECKIYREEEASGINIKMVEKKTDYYMFFKVTDNSSKLDKLTMAELMKDVKE